MCSPPVIHVRLLLVCVLPACLATYLLLSLQEASPVPVRRAFEWENECRTRRSIGGRSNEGTRSRLDNCQRVIVFSASLSPTLTACLLLSLCLASVATSGGVRALTALLLLSFLSLRLARKQDQEECKKEGAQCCLLRIHMRSKRTGREKERDERQERERRREARMERRSRRAAGISRRVVRSERESSCASAATAQATARMQEQQQQQQQQQEEEVNLTHESNRLRSAISC